MNIEFSHSQIIIYDASVQMPGCDWSEVHVAQGFARRDSVVNMGTLLEFGTAALTVSLFAARLLDKYERIISVPFYAPTGRVCIEGPEEIAASRCFDVPKGWYRLVVAQHVDVSSALCVDVYFEQQAELLRRSTIIRANEGMRPPDVLEEDAPIA